MLTWPVEIEIPVNAVTPGHRYVEREREKKENEMKSINH